MQSQQVLLDLGAQRKLLRRFLSWLEQDLQMIQQGWRSFFGHEIPKTDTVKRVKELISLAAKVQEMDLDTLNVHLESARELIHELDEMSRVLDTMMEEEAAMMR